MQVIKSNRMFIVKGEIYPFDILVSFGDSEKKLRKELSKILPDETAVSELFIDPLGAGRTMIFSTGQTLLWLKEKPTDINGLATLNHEIFHCVCFILERIGVTFSADSDEAYAYFIQHLTNKMYSEIGITFS
jgi:hypothetical protein